MSVFRSLLLVTLGLFSFYVSAQQPSTAKKPETHEEMNARIISIIEMQTAMSDEEKKWLNEVLDGGCECSELKNKQEMETCGEKLFLRMGVPITEEGLNNMTEEQERKFMLLSPLTMMLGKCPEHGG